MPRKFNDLSNQERHTIDLVRTALARFGCPSERMSDESIDAWVNRNFPNWHHRSLFPFFLAERGSAALTVAGRSAHSLVWCSCQQAMDFERYETGELRDAGYLWVGSDAGGNYIAVDTNSQLCLEIALIDLGEIASYGLKERSIARPGMEMDRFLNWVYETPDVMYKFWTNHYEQLPDEED